MNDSLVTYLHDHLAGSNFAVELLSGWEKNHPDRRFAAFAGKLKREIEDDQFALRELIDRLGGGRETMKEALGWIAEKAARWKLRDAANEALGRFEGLEMLSLGILGKLALWHALERLPPGDARVTHLDLRGLADRARDHHARVEAERLAIAPLALCETHAT